MQKNSQLDWRDNMEAFYKKPVALPAETLVLKHARSRPQKIFYHLIVVSMLWCAGEMALWLGRTASSAVGLELDSLKGVPGRDEIQEILQ